MTAILESLPNTNGSPQHWQGASSEREPLMARLVEATARQTPARRLTYLAAAVVAVVLLLHPGVRYHAAETLRGALGMKSPHNDVPLFKVSNSKGLCRLEYTVRTYDGANAPACDPSLCVGREKLKLLTNLKHQRRWSAFDEGTYMELFSNNNISGWLQEVQVQYVKKFTRKQHELGIYGAVGEIGVHHGKFLIPIVGNALVDEPAVAMDLFEDQGSNTDGSGRGSKSYLLHNLEASGIPENTITLLGGNSMQLSAKNFTSRGFPAFRLVSVDGGHTLEITLHDMMVASCLVREGGLVVLDDFPNPTWIGVAEALMHFGHAQDRLVPFMHGYNKVWFATKGHVQQYIDFIASDPETFKCQTHLHESRRAVAGHALCYTGPFT